MAKKRTPKKKPQVLNNKAKPAAAKLKRPEFSESKIVKELYEHAKLAFKTKHDKIALQSLQKALKLDPIHPESLALQAVLIYKHAKTAKQKNHAIMLLQAACYQNNDRKDWLQTLARWLAERNEMLAALSAMERSVLLDSKNNTALMQIAGIYGSLGFEEQSVYYTRQALKSNPVTTTLCTGNKKMTIAVLMTATSDLIKLNRKTFSTQINEGHNNLPSVLDSAHITVKRVFVDNFMHDKGLLQELKSVDVVYNGITDPERGENALSQADNICQSLDLPIVNTPAAVLQSSREGNYQRFRDNETVILPKSVKLEGISGCCRNVVRDAIAANDMMLPVILRVAGFQGGKFMHMIRDLDNHDFSEIDELTTTSPQTLYLIQYHDVSYRDERSGDTSLYPKYRAFMVDGKLYPVHLFTADSFNVHKKNADPVMGKYDWLIEKEKAYCEDPTTHLGEHLWREIEAALASMGLEYNGIDFAPASTAEEQGKIVVFEINPAMRNWVASLPKGDHVQLAWHRITHAAHEMLCKKAQIAPWEFALPEGTEETVADGVRVSPGSSITIRPKGF